MGRKVQVRDSYLGDVMSVARLRDAARIDSRLTPEQLQDVETHAAALMAALMNIENERATSNAGQKNETRSA